MYGGCSLLGKHTSRAPWENPLRAAARARAAALAAIYSRSESVRHCHTEGRMLQAAADSEKLCL